MLENPISERVVLSSLINDKNIREKYIYKLNLKLFFNDFHKRIFEYILDLHIDKKEITPDVVLAKFQNNRQIEEILLTTTATFKTMNIHISNLTKAEYNRQVLKVIKLTETKVKNGEEFNPQDLFSNITKVEEDIKYKSLIDALNNYEESLKNQTEYNNATGLKDLDEMVYTSAGDLIIIGARPSMGKTAFIVSTAINRLKMGYGCAIFSLEMPTEKILTRAMANIGKIPLNEFRRGQFSSIEAYNKAKKYLIDNQENFKIIDEISDIDLIIRLIEHIYQNNPLIEDFFIDHLTYITTSKNYIQEHLKLKDITVKLKELAKRLGIKIWLLSQLNRSLENRPNKRPMMSDLRESGSIEENADIILSLYRQSYYDIKEAKEKGENLKEQHPNIMEIGILKQRDGEVGRVEVMFNGPLMSIYDKTLSINTQEYTISEDSSNTIYSNPPTIETIEGNLNNTPDFNSPTVIDMPIS